MPECYIIIARKIFYPIFFFGGGGVPPAPSSRTPMLSFSVGILSVHRWFHWSVQSTEYVNRITDWQRTNDLKILTPTHWIRLLSAVDRIGPTPLRQLSIRPRRASVHTSVRPSDRVVRNSNNRFAWLTKQRPYNIPAYVRLQYSNPWMQLLTGQRWVPTTRHNVKCYYHNGKR